MSTTLFKFQFQRALGLVAAAILYLIASPVSAAPITIDFESLSPSLVGQIAISVPSPFSEDGFAVATTVGVPSLEGFEAYGTAAFDRYTGSAALHNGICCSNTLLELT